MLRHDYIAIDVESVTTPHPFQGRLEDSAVFFGGSQATAMVTAECDEMILSAVVEAGKSPWHEDNLACRAGCLSDV
jgi:hypothetical protein